MSNEQKQPQEGKPLTVEEMLLKAHNIERLTFSLRELVLPAMEQYTAQQTASLREELEVVKKERDEATENYKVAFANRIELRSDLSKAERQRDEAEKQLEAVKKDRNKALDDFGSLQFSSVQKERKHLKELAAVKKENGKMNNVINDLKGELSKVTRQRDEGEKIIRRFVAIAERSDQHRESDFYHHTNNEALPYLERLSYGETKRANNCWENNQPQPCTGQEIKSGQCGCNPTPPES